MTQRFKAQLQRVVIRWRLMIMPCDWMVGLGLAMLLGVRRGRGWSWAVKRARRCFKCLITSCSARRYTFHELATDLHACMSCLPNPRFSQCCIGGLGQSQSQQHACRELCASAKLCGVQAAHGCSWLHLLERSNEMREVIYLPPDAKSPPLRALSCFEDPKYIHNTAFLPSSQPAAAYNSAMADAEGGHPSDSSTLRFELVRHRLAFDVRGGVLESIQHRGWHVRCSDRDADMARGAAALPPGLCDFLVLHPDSPVATLLVLIPDGTIETSGDRSEVIIEQSDAPEAQCGHHVYSVHPRTGMLSCATIEARLFLAALYAACGCAVAVPGTGRTGGEMALELVRQSAVNRPLSVAEARNLETVAQFAGHTPALRIAVAHLAEQAAAVAFLHTDADAAGEPAAAFAARMAVNPEEGAVYEQAQRAAPPPFGNCRAALTRTERRLQFACANAFQHGAHAVRLHEKVDWQGVGDDLTHSAVCALQQRSREMGERLTPKPQERRRARVATSVTLPFDIPSGYGALGEELASGLLQSLAACAEDGADLASAAGAEPDASTLASVAADLHTLADDVQLAERKLREALLQALALTPAGRSKHNLEALRGAGLVAVPAVSDLVLAAMEAGLIQACISPGHDDHFMRPASLDVPHYAC